MSYETKSRPQCASHFLILNHQIDVLPDIVRAVDGKAEVYLDGGVRTGTDVLKALALGARCVFIGRPVLWGLAHNVSPIFQVRPYEK